MFQFLARITEINQLLNSRLICTCFPMKRKQDVLICIYHLYLQPLTTVKHWAMHVCVNVSIAGFSPVLTITLSKMFVARSHGRSSLLHLFIFTMWVSWLHIVRSWQQKVEWYSSACMLLMCPEAQSSLLLLLRWLTETFLWASEKTGLTEANTKTQSLIVILDFCLFMSAI